MIRVVLPIHLYNEMSDIEISDICKLSYDISEFKKEAEDRGYNSGQYIKLYKDEEVKYICLSRSDLQSRNAFILQNFPSSYQHFLEEKNENKKFEYYIRFFGQAHPLYVIFSYKVLLTIGIRILNLNKVVPSERVDYLDHRTPFIDFKQMRKARIDLQQRNSGNTSTLFEENDCEISVYGKSYGANGRETTAICLALKKLVDLPIKVYNVNETDPAHLASVDPANKYIFDYYGIEVDSESIDFESTDANVIAKRNSKKYHYNLLQKFHEKKCYLCGCDMENLIIGSHIHRVTDILHSNLPENEKQKMIIDGDNGFWLCANHDKMFEYGLIYFNNDEMQIKKDLSDEQKEFIIESTFYLRKIYESFDCDSKIMVINKDEVIRRFKISSEHYTERMHEYLDIHKSRVNGQNIMEG